MPSPNKLTAKENAFSQPIINIGSDLSNDLILPGNSVKAFHCMLMSQDGLWQFVPVSTENLSINGQPVTDSRVIENGDILTIGDYRLDLVLNGMTADIFTTALGIVSIPTVETPSVNAGQGGSLLIYVKDTEKEVRPGNSAEYLVNVTNAGALVANMQLEVQGIDPDWVEIIPPVLNLNESQHGQFTVRITPPNDPKTLAGTYHLHLALLSPNYPGETAGENVSLKILPFYNYLIGNYTPQRIWANRRNPIAETTFTIRNLSNTELPLTLQTTDDANQASYEYVNKNGVAYSSQLTGSIEAGETETIHLKVRPHKLPIFGWSRYSTIHFTTSANRPEDPSSSQMISGQIGVRPLINVFWLILTSIFLAITALIVMLPRIKSFTVNDEQSVIVYRSSLVNLKWDVSRFATKLELTAEDDDTPIDVFGKKNYSPVIRKSQHYKLTASNWISRTLGVEFSKEINVIEIPHIPEIDLHRSPATTLNSGDSVDLSWNVTSDPNSAEMIVNRVHTKLEEAKFSGQSTFPANEDTLVSIIGENETGSVTKSLFIDVKQPKVDMISFAIYVRPDGAAVGADGQTTTWRFAKGIDTEPKKIAAAFKGRYQTILEIPEQEFDSGPQVIPTAIIPDAFVPEPSVPSAPSVSAPEPKQEVIFPAEIGISDEIPQNSPENADLQSKFTIKLAEAISDPSMDSGYRVINYYPQYSVEKEEQVMIQWTVNGVKNVMVTPLAEDPLSPNAINFYNPKETTNFILAAEANGEKYNYAIPVNVAESDGGDKSCALNISSTSLKAPGNVTLNWVSQGITRLQLLSDVQANEDTKEEEEQTKEESEVREKKEKGVLSDNLEAAGFMKVNVSQETSFVLRGYDASGEIACNQVQKVTITPEKTKKQTKLTITKTTDKDGNQNRIEVISGGKTYQFDTYRVNQPAWVYFKLSNPEATGTVVITDGKASCTATLPENKCQLTFTEAGAPDPDPAKDQVKTLSAKYSGDDNFAPTTSSYQVKVFIPSISIITATDKDGNQTTIPIDTDEGTDWISAFYAGTTARITYNLKDPEGNIIQDENGEVTISDGKNKCTAKASEPFCYLTFESPGNPSPLEEKDYLKTLKASYSVNGKNIDAESADYPVFVFPPYAEIEKTTDKDGVQHTIKVGPYKTDEYDYHYVGQDAMVNLVFPGDLNPKLKDLDLKGTVTVTDGEVSCKVNLPNTSCYLKDKGFKTPGPPNLDPAKDYVKMLSVTYISEDSSYKKETTYPVKVFPKQPPSLEITKTTDKNDKQNTEDVTYQGETYTFDTHIVENLLNIEFKLPETDASGGKITILMEGKEVCTKAVPVEHMDGHPGEYKCAIDVTKQMPKFEDVGPSFPDNPLKDRVKTITAKYSGDDKYSDISVSYDVKVYPKKDANLAITKTTYDEEGKDRRQISRDGGAVYDLHLVDTEKKWVFTKLAESDATGTVEIFDGEGPLCTATLSGGKGSCSFNGFTAAGSKTEDHIKTLTAKYSGDDNYYPVSAEYKVKVFDKIPTELLINQVTTSESEPEKDDLKFTFTYDPDISKAIDTYNIDPTGTITLTTRYADKSKTPNKITCELKDTGTCTRGGTVEAHFVPGQNVTEITLKGISITEGLTDKKVGIYKLDYTGDAYFGTSESPEFEFERIKTITKIESIEDLHLNEAKDQLLASVYCSVEVDRYTPSEYQKWIDQGSPDLNGDLRLDSVIKTDKQNVSGYLIAPADFINFPIISLTDPFDLSATYEGSEFFDDSEAQWTEKIKVDGTKIEFLRPYENTNVKDGMITADVKIRLTANDDNDYHYKVLHNGILTLYFEGKGTGSKYYVINLAEETLLFDGAPAVFQDRIVIDESENTITIKQVDLYGRNKTGAYYAEFFDPFEILESADADTPSIKQVTTKVVSGNNTEITENNGTVTLKTEIKVQTPKSEWEALGITMPKRYYGDLEVWHQNSKDSKIKVNLNDTNIFSDVKEVKAVEGGKDVYYYETSGIVTLNNIVLPTETGEASPVYADYLGNDFMTQQQIIALRPLAYQTSTDNLTNIRITEDPKTGKLSLDFDITVKSKRSGWDAYKTPKPEKFFGTLEVNNRKDGKVLKTLSLTDPDFSTVTEIAGYYQSTGHIKMDIGKLSDYQLYCKFSGSNLMEISTGGVTYFECITPIVSAPYNIHIARNVNESETFIGFNIDVSVSINTWKNTYGMAKPERFFGKMDVFFASKSWTGIKLHETLFSPVIEENGYYKSTASITLYNVGPLPGLLYGCFTGTDLMNKTTGPSVKIDSPVMFVSKPYDIIVSKDSDNNVGIKFKIDIKSEKRWWENDQYTIDLRDNRFPGRFIVHYKDNIDEEHHMYATNFFSKIELKDSYYISTGTFFINDVGALSDSGSYLWGEIIRSDIMPAPSGPAECIKRAVVDDFHYTIKKLSSLRWNYHFDLILRETPYLIDIPSLSLTYRFSIDETDRSALCTISGHTISADTTYSFISLFGVTNVRLNEGYIIENFEWSDSNSVSLSVSDLTPVE